ncbi:MAG: glutamate-5-semialdehyde dehydrogenase, partial [Deltaproteobacteria bacterium]|nr:glutamate-5-semialdehyde dehydrogenase [Deltaproteobacteria bacterium]
MTVSNEMTLTGERARAASRGLAVASTRRRNAALENMAAAIMEARADIKAANTEDLKAGREAGLSEAMLDRLEMHDARIEAMARGVAQVADLPDPVGTELSCTIRPNGLVLSRVRVPIGVVAILFESRPNVTADAASLCIKSGNAAILRGGKEAIRTNSAIADVFSGALDGAGLPPDSVQLMRTTDHAAVGELLSMDRFIDVVIPRGGKALIERVTQEARMPVIKHFEGICHVYVDRDADMDMASEIALNSKCQRPGVCNAMESLLVHKDVAGVALGPILERLRDAGVEIVGDDGTRAVAPWVGPANEDDWRTEYLALKLSV